MIFDSKKKPTKPGWYFISYLNTMAPRALIVEIRKFNTLGLCIWDKELGYFSVDKWDEEDVIWGDEIVMPNVEFE